MDFSTLKENQINVQNGINYCGDEARYLATMQRYFRLYDNNCEKMKNALAENSADFTTLVHSLKSTSRMIGADELADVAAKMEAASKECNQDYIRQNVDTLFEQYKNVIESIRVYGEMEPVQIPGVISEREALEIGDKLLEALDDYDGDEAKLLMERFLKFPFRFTVKRRLKEAKNDISEYLFDEAYEIVKEAVGEIQ